MAKQSVEKKVATKKPGRSKNLDKWELARMLYTNNRLTQKEVALRVGVTEKTLGKWITEGYWEDLQKSLLTTKDEQLRSFYTQLSALNKAISEREEGNRYATSKEADAMCKITAAIANLETETNVGEIMQVSKLLINHIQSEDMKLSKVVARYCDTLIKDRLKRRS